MYKCKHSQLCYVDLLMLGQNVSYVSGFSDENTIQLLRWRFLVSVYAGQPPVQESTSAKTHIYTNKSLI